MEFDDAAAAVDFGDALLLVRHRPTQQVDHVLGGFVAGFVAEPHALGLVFRRIGEDDHGLDHLALAGERRRLAAGQMPHTGGDSQGAVEAGAGQRIENVAEGLVEDAAKIGRTQRQLRALLIHIVQLLAEEPEAAVLLLAERHHRVLQQPPRPPASPARPVKLPSTDGCIRLATFWSVTGMLPRI